jgi:hypothetical protein
MKVKHVTKDLAVKTKALASNDKAAAALSRELDGHRAAVVAAQTALDGVTLRARWVTLRARWVTLIARGVTLRARGVTLRAR